MIKIGIIPNLGKEECREVFISFCGMLSGKAELSATDGVFSLPGGEAEQNCKELEEIAALCNVKVTDAESFFADIDIAVVMGGDGSLLRAAPGAAIHGKPLLGINLGRVGYLASAEKGEKFQFVRTGYFCKDTKYENCYNQIVGLKDSYKS